ncbi:acyl-CoA dehydrogenase family protein [Spongorhabdus nitratireducens]
MKDICFIRDHVACMPEFWHSELGLSPEDIESIFEITEGVLKFSKEYLQPFSAEADRLGSRLVDGEVITPPGYKAAYEQYARLGLPGMTLPETYGGSGLPMSGSLIGVEITGFMDWPWSMFPGLSLGAANTIVMHGDEKLKNLFLPRLASGEFLGTMCLTEAHCGTDVGASRTRATPQEDGSFRIRGTKIFISAGRHDLGVKGTARNTIHIVLARPDGAEEGTRGLGLFVVPERTVNPETGEVGDSNNVYCRKIEDKLGLHGSPTCELEFDDAIGYQLGEPGLGFKQMTSFMNFARLGTASQGLIHMSRGLVFSKYYAGQRQSMRAASGTKYPGLRADLLVSHPNIQHKLMILRAQSLIQRSKIYEAAKYADLAQHGKTQTIRDKAFADLRRVTPVLKKGATDRGVSAALDCIGIYGGHGYITDHPCAQNLTEAVIGTLYEGQNDIQAMDFMLRGIAKDRGAGMSLRVFNIITRATRHAITGPHRWEGIMLATRASMGALKIGSVLMRSAVNFDQGVLSSSAVLNLYDALDSWGHALAIIQAAQDQLALGNAVKYHAGIQKIMLAYIPELQAQVIYWSKQCSTSVSRLTRIGHSELADIEGKEVD